MSAPGGGARCVVEAHGLYGQPAHCLGYLLATIGGLYGDCRERVLHLSGGV